MRKEWHRLFYHENAFMWAILLLTAIPIFPEYCAPVLAIASLFVAGVDARKRNKDIQIGPLGKILLVYLIYTAIGIFYSAHPLNSLSTFAMWAVMFCGYLTVTTVVYTRRRLHTALFLVGIVAAFIGAVACVQYLLITVLDKEVSNQLWLPLDEFFYRYFPMDIDLHMADNRASGTFNNPNILGEYLAMLLPLIGYYGFSEFRTRRSLLTRIFLFIAILGAAVSFSRGAYIAMLSILLMIFVSNLKRITPLALCVVAAISLIPEAIMNRFLSIGKGGSDSAISERFEAWDVAIRTIIERPLFGLGPGVSNFWEKLQNAGVGAPHSHNLVLQILVEGGFVALFILCMIAIRMLQNSLELANRNRHGSGLGNSLVMFVVAFVVYGMVDYPFLSPKLVGNFLMIIGFADVIAHIYLRQPFAALLSVPITLWQRTCKRFASLNPKKISKSP